MPSLIQDQSPLANYSLTIRNLLTLLRVPISKTTLDTASYYPDHPSISSLCLFLNEIGLATFATRITPHQLTEIGLPALSVAPNNSGNFVILTEITDQYITFHESTTGWKTLVSSEFYRNWPGTVILVEADHNSGDPHFNTNIKRERLQHFRKLVLLAAATAILLTSIAISSDIQMLTLVLLSIVGLVINVGLVSIDIGVQGSERFCYQNKKINCNSVLQSPAATLLGWLKMSDAGLVWFLGTWIFSTVTNLTNNTAPFISTMAGASILTALYAPYSIYYQWRVVKKWCTLCILTQVVLVGTAVALFSFHTTPSLSSITPTSLGIATASYLFSALLWVALKPIIKKATELPYRIHDLFKIKRNAGIFKAQLASMGKTAITPLANELRSGPADAPLQLTMVTNPYCEPCAVVHQQLEPLISQFNGQLSILYRFATDHRDPEQKGMTFIKHLFSLPDEKQMEGLNTWLRDKDYERWSNLFPPVSNQDAAQRFFEHDQWCASMNITKTPTIFLNGNEIPEQYKVDDLIFHLRTTSLVD